MDAALLRHAESRVTRATTGRGVRCASLLFLNLIDTMPPRTGGVVNNDCGG